jgi:deazaflavin-dependent oxidoreductase (nitroreductase family)
MADISDWNRRIVEEFRAKGGKVSGQFEGANLLLLHTTGARSGQERINPLAYQELGDGRYAVFGSKGGSPRHPDWYRNIVANPDVKVEVGTDAFDATARVAEGEERDRIWTTQKAAVPGFAEYERRTARQIPVIVLSRAG